MKRLSVMQSLQAKTLMDSTLRMLDVTVWVNHVSFQPHPLECWRSLRDATFQLMERISALLTDPRTLVSGP